MFIELGLDDGAAWRLVALIRMLGRLPLPSSVASRPASDRAPALVRALVADESVRPYIRVNVWEGVNWFNRESFAQVLWWMLALDALDALETAPAAAAGVDWVWQIPGVTLPAIVLVPILVESLPNRLRMVTPQPVVTPENAVLLAPVLLSM